MDIATAISLFVLLPLLVLVQRPQFVPAIPEATFGRTVAQVVTDWTLDMVQTVRIEADLLPTRIRGGLTDAFFAAYDLAADVNCWVIMTRFKLLGF